MKTTTNSPAFKRILTLSLCSASILLLTSWSPPNSEGIYLSSGKHIQIRNSVIDILTSNNPSIVNEYRDDEAALIIGAGNDLNLGSLSAERARGLVVGVDNDLMTDWRLSTVLGQRNKLRAGWSLVVGSDNTVAGRRSSDDNLIDNAYDSAVFGTSNQVYASRSHAMGYDNLITKSFGIAIGFGLTTSEHWGTALGRYNEDMDADDVLVVGTGSSHTDRSTALVVKGNGEVSIGVVGALRITESGQVVLANAQGDISMGAYE